MNENGVKDVATEDRNGDGSVDVDDCTGLTGPAGPAGAPGPVTSAFATNSANDVLAPTCSGYAPQQITIAVPAGSPAGRVLVTAFVGVDITHSLNTISRWSLNVATSALGCLSAVIGAADTWTDEIPASAATLTYSRTAYLQRSFFFAAGGGSAIYWIVGLSTGDATADAYDYVNIVAVFYAA